MIEVIVAIGVMLVLITIGVYGFRHVNTSARLRSTHVQLDNGQGMLAEYEANGATLAQLTTEIGSNQIPKPKNGALKLKSVLPGGNTYLEAVGNCQAAVLVLTRVDKNKSALSAIPPDSIIDTSKMTDTTNAVTPALADGWGNPIVFVPGDKGLAVNVNDGKDAKTIFSPDRRPFWASAGPDGDFSKGDDNVYSFEK
jgi:type II secretory pathway pseudopilin PulG